MKTKFKSLFTVALAAATFASCSNEIDAPENGAMLSPGDARITIGLGDGTTTYSTTALESAIKNGSGVLFSGANKIALTDATIKDVSGNIQFSATIKAGDFTEGASANLYLYINGTPSASDTDANTKASTVSTGLNRDLTNGLPAGFGPTAVTLKAGTITGKAELVRAAARIGARAGAGVLSDIKDYTVELTNPNVTSGSLFGTVASALGSVKQSYKLKGDATSMFNGETVAYVYPSPEVSGEVIAPDGVTKKSFKVTPARGKNYTVVITPKTPSAGGAFDFEVTVKGWDGNTDTDVDFGGGETKVTLPNNPIAGVPGFAGDKDGNLVIDAKTAAAGLVTAAGVSLTAEQLLGAPIATKEASFSVTATRADEKVISADGNLALSASAKTITISALPNHSTDVKYTIEVTGATSKTKYLVSVLVKGSGFHPRFISSFNGFQVMQIAMVKDGDGKDVTSAVFDDFEKTYYANPVAHSFFNGATAKSEYFNKGGNKLSTDVCPKGFRMLKNKEELMKFLGMATWTVIGEKTPTGTNTPIMAGAIGIRSGSVGIYHSALLKSAAGEELAIVGDETIRTADGFFFQFLSSNKYSTGVNTTSKNLRCVKDSFK